MTTPEVEERRFERPADLAAKADSEVHRVLAIRGIARLVSQGEGTTADAVAYIQISVDGQRSAGAAFDRDTVSASLRALLAAINRAQHARAAA